MKVCSPPDHFHKNMSHDQLLFLFFKNISTLYPCKNHEV